MTLKTTTIGILAAVALTAPSSLAMAGSALDQALAEGADRLTGDEIAERFVGNTGTWVSASGDKTIDIHYGEDGALRARMLDGDWSGTGRYGVTDTDRICVSWDGSDPARLRCLDVLAVDGTVTKFNADGSLNGSYMKFEKGEAL